MVPVAWRGQGPTQKTRLPEGCGTPFATSDMHAHTLHHALLDNRPSILPPHVSCAKKAPRLHDEDQGEDLELVNVEASPVPATFTYLRRLSVARMTFVREMSDVDCRHHLTTTGG